MANVRSPNYPSMSLPAAIDRIRRIHAAEGKNAIARESIVQLIGFNGLHGASAKALSAIGKYGLLESLGDGEARVSELALQIIAPESDEEKEQALNEAAFKPALFAEIKDKWPNNYPSDENLRSYLIRRGFSSAALDQVIACFRDTVGVLRKSTSEQRSLVQAVSENSNAISMPKLERKDPPTQGGYDIGFVGAAINISGQICSQTEAKKVIAALTALSSLLPTSKTVEFDSPTDRDEYDDLLT
ncbi:hypothetical protein EPK99_13465 [Neorhizobium lilium]|uniref:Uncharacterized protein n=1 Tax=Neorhizobium lilium TaxID=2503024 RepID=A0A444LEQ4_9HYPH|nr:hypothetical protein [Neorhizobium lilium]RWX76682.1 hypothetical protein EPK99_13465 [Neorhizobium lilium]